MNANELQLIKQLKVKRRHETGVFELMRVLKIALASKEFNTKGVVFVKHSKDAKIEKFFCSKKPGWIQPIVTKNLRVNWLPSIKMVSVTAL